MGCGCGKRKRKKPLKKVIVQTKAKKCTACGNILTKVNQYNAQLSKNVAKFICTYKKCTYYKKVQP
jgi:hypothetical protein